LLIFKWSSIYFSSYLLTNQRKNIFKMIFLVNKILLIFLIKTDLKERKTIWNACGIIHSFQKRNNMICLIKIIKNLFKSHEIKWREKKYQKPSKEWFWWRERWGRIYQKKLTFWIKNESFRENCWWDNIWADIIHEELVSLKTVEK